MATRRQMRYRAQRLFFTKRYTSKQICEMVGVTPATMSKWIKRYGWKNPENAGFVKKVKASGLISMDFYNHLKEHSPVLLDAIVYELEVFTGANKSITVGQSEKLKLLMERSGITINADGQYLLLSEVAGRPICKVSQLKSDEAAHLIDSLSIDDQTHELTIKHHVTN